MVTDEEKRQHAVATEFIKLHPEYVPTIEHTYKLLDWMELRDMKMTLEGLELAYKAVFCGEPEPKVMSPDLVFKRVKPTQHTVPHVQNLDLLAWKPVSTGINSAATSLLEEFLPVPVDDDDGWNEFTVPGTGFSSAPKEAPTEKTVAPMPTAWYSGDVVELKTKRRIKDD
jgi:hypothetical protein